MQIISIVVFIYLFICLFIYFKKKTIFFYGTSSYYPKVTALPLVLQHQQQQKRTRE